jgi:hypothetical protein
MPQPDTNLTVGELLEAAGRFARPELDELVAGILELRARRGAPVASTRESELLLRINEGLPEALVRRLQELTPRREAETLSDEEQQELTRLSDEVERREAARLEALSELASLRQTTLPQVMRDLGLTPATDG